MTLQLLLKMTQPFLSGTGRVFEVCCMTIDAIFIWTSLYAVIGNWYMNTFGS